MRGWDCQPRHAVSTGAGRLAGWTPYERRCIHRPELRRDERFRRPPGEHDVADDARWNVVDSPLLHEVELRDHVVRESDGGEALVSNIHLPSIPRAQVGPSGRAEPL